MPLTVSTPATPQQVPPGQPKTVFQGVTIADDAGQTDAVVITVRDANGNLTDANGTFLPNPFLIKTGVGVYASVQLTPSVHGIDPNTLTQTIDSLVFNPSPDIGNNPVNSTIGLFVYNANTATISQSRALLLQETPQPANAPVITGINSS